MRFVYLWDEQQFLNSALYDYYLGSKKDRRQLFFLALLAAVFGILAIKWIDEGFQALDLFLIALALVWLGLRKHLLVWMFRRAFRRSGQSGLQLSFDVEEDALKVQVNSKPPQEYLWSDIQRVVRTEKGFLIYPGLLWLPNQALQGDVLPSEAAALFQRRARHYVDKSQVSLKLPTTVDANDE